MSVLGIPKIIQSIDIVFICAPELDSKFLLLKIPHNLERGHRETKLNRNWMFYSCSLAFILLKGSMQTVGEEKWTVASGCKPYAPQYWRAWHDVLIGAIAACMFFGLPTTFRSDFRPILLEEIHAGTVELVKSLWLGWSQRPYGLYILSKFCQMDRWSMNIYVYFHRVLKLSSLVRCRL